MLVRPAAVAVALLAAFLGAALAVSAQEALPIGGSSMSVQLGVAKPFVAQDGLFAGARRQTTLWDAAVVVPLEDVTFFARTGLAYAAIEGLDDGLTIANPRIGAMIGRESRNAEIHVDLPFAKEFGEQYATGIGIFSDYEEFERFRPDMWALGGSATATFEPGPGAFLGARVGAKLVTPEGGDADVWGSLTLYGEAPTDRTRFRFAISGNMLATRSGLGFSDRSYFFAALGVSWPFSGHVPGIYVRAPIDESLDGTVPIVVGFRFHVGG